MGKKITLATQEMQKLEELGLDTSDASMCYRIFGREDIDGELIDLLPWIGGKFPSNGYFIPAYTLQDIIENLPEYIMENVTDDGFEILGRNELISRYLDFSNLLDSAYNLLVMCLENHYDKDTKQWKKLEVSSTDE